MRKIIDFQFPITFLNIRSISTNDPSLESPQCQEGEESIECYLQRL